MTTTKSLPDQFWKYALAIGIVVAGYAVIDRVYPRLGTWYIIIILLGVALTQREGVLKFTSWLQSQTSTLGGSK